MLSGVKMRKLPTEKSEGGRLANFELRPEVLEAAIKVRNWHFEIHFNSKTI